jgi:hypothetical protein
MSQAKRGSSPGNLDEWPDWLHCIAFVLLVPFILWRLGKDKPAVYKNGDKYVPITKQRKQ